MRLYSFTLTPYLSSIQHGIQTAHVVHTMGRKYEKPPRRPEDFEYHLEAKKVYDDWADGKEGGSYIYVKAGGDASNLWTMYQELRDIAQKLNLPFARWYESKEALNGALTAVAIIPTEEIMRWVDPVPAMANNWGPILSMEPRARLQRLINQCPFAN